MFLKDFCKVLTGYSIHEIAFHGAFAVNGLTFRMLGVNVTPGLNMFAVVFWTVVLVLAVYFAWFKK